MYLHNIKYVMEVCLGISDKYDTLMKFILNRIRATKLITPIADFGYFGYFVINIILLCGVIPEHHRPSGGLSAL